jgi:hypothetical protein
MNHIETLNRLNDYADHSLSEEDRSEVEEHLQTCEPCSREMQKLDALLKQATSLARSIEPPRELWSRIAPMLGTQEPKLNPLSSAFHRSGRWGFEYRSWARYSTRIAAALVVAVGGFWLASRPSPRAWEVARLEGTPTIGDQHLTHGGQLAVGDWLETDAFSRAQLTIADIGHAEIGPNSRLRLVATRETEHRLEMTQGRLTAWVSAPPRIFIVETPSGTAVDLGCSYDLFVNESGNGTIHVTSGEVSLEFDGKESFVPTGTMCETRRGFGPGTPYSDLSSDVVRTALRQFDFEKGGAKSVELILQNAANIDAVTLWHLLQRVDEPARETVYDRFAALVPPPKQVTKEGILRLDKNMLEDWLNEFAVRSFSLKRLF